jgi:hypothetical protein
VRPEFRERRLQNDVLILRLQALYIGFIGLMYQFIIGMMPDKHRGHGLRETR